MPTYEYECQACGEECEIFHSMSEEPKKKCPACGKLQLKKLISSGGGLIFKGSGFYITDYRSDSYEKDAKADQSGGDSKKEAASSNSDSGGQSESKSSDTGASKTAETSSSSSESSSSKSSKGSSD